ncbi:MAG: type II secretion system protein GspD [Bdellovibrionales bacterium]
MRIRALFHLCCVFVLFGCGGILVPDARPTTGRLPTLAEVPDPDETVRGANDPPIVTLPIGSALRERRLARTEEMPDKIIVPTTNLTAVPVTLALQAVLEGTDISMSWQTGDFDSKLVTVTNLSGPLPRVVDKICRSARVFCSYRDDMLEVKEKETFIIELPAAPVKTEVGADTSTSANNTMAETISMLAGSQARIDAQGGNLIYTADVENHESVQEYLMQLRNGRPLIVMQLYIWEVVLDKDNATGINWDSFSFDNFKALGQDIALSGSTTFTSITTPGVSLGATTSGAVDAQTLLRFLHTKGNVQTISNPQLTFISGSSSEFRVGGEQRYISQVGELTSSSVSGTSSASLGSNTISTDSLDTGLTVQVSGAFENGVVSAYLTVDIQDIVSLNSTTTSQGVTIDLPETSERSVETTLRVRPGDNLVLAGLVSSRDENNADGVPTPFGTIPTYHSDQLENTELVMLVKPSVVMFSSEKEKEEEWKGVADTVQMPKGKYILDALVIDKDGAQKIQIPDVPIEPMLSQEGEEKISHAPIVFKKKSDAPVNENFMQRGFSHAFEDLLNVEEKGE